MHSKDTPFNPNKHYLGSVCKRGHDWNDSGKSVRLLSSNDCIQCARERPLRYAHNRTCDLCGMSFYRSDSGIKAGRAYCSVDCFNKRDYSPPVDNGDGTASVPLSLGMVATIDAVDIRLVSSSVWHASHSKGGRYYAKSGSSGSRVYMHRLILGLVSTDAMADHINGDTLDNRRANLRVVSISENNTNKKGQARSTSKYKGIEPVGQKWCARIGSKGARYYLGVFDTPEKAARAYDDAARELHGEFARLNFPN